LRPAATVHRTPAPEQTRPLQWVPAQLSIVGTPVVTPKPSGERAAIAEGNTAPMQTEMNRVDETAPSVSAAAT
jgi:hypothetical protein